MIVSPYFTAEKAVLPFDKVIELERIDAWLFRSKVKAFSTSGGEYGTYGGHVFAQAAWAAAQTVAEGMLIHNITGWFILSGQPNERQMYKVDKIRDGRNYCTRSVTVVQDAGQAMFTCTCSFKREETSPFDVQEHTDLKKKYCEVLEGKQHEPMLHDAAPSNDSEDFRERYLPSHPEHFNPIGGLHFRRTDMGKYNASRDPLERRQLTFYTLRGSLPLPPLKKGKGIVTREANLHACAHLYASDRNSLFMIPNHLDRGKEFTSMASLAHTVIFHVGVKDLIMPPEPHIDHPNADRTHWGDEKLSLCSLDGYEENDRDADGRKWFVQEAWTTRVTGGRALHTSRMWDYERGVHIATTLQDGMIRFDDGKARVNAKI
ncbi:Thioesterase/thiol ester dehydrase-isomerase [Didymella exigua CBS 183.55]|uniref:Thioesterase/thiol ester dehydrase-isomerase n=1 Tax=Didymella exigua CBS 183.55 TaxID=1150837 RepID=A0A6A5RLH0_9PLEO|nr:Thioesterase/thiol ester dehydrase-isomerase [Didymella exigua CBS 183.55]KAF1928100.1 Thioesterase/thiol ester dehydrase-isomerase [Didymella exigua CBS 183.55]